ncbi:MAG: hypothetical protein WC459_04375 [Patescibacteria group bacterium]
MRYCVAVLLSILFFSFSNVATADVSNNKSKSIKKQNQEKPEVVVKKDYIAIQASKGVYIYLLKEKRSEFLTGTILNGEKAVLRVILDKNDKPIVIVLMIKDEQGNIQQMALRRNERTEDTYKKMEKYVADFIKEFEVKEILRDRQSI